MHFLTRLINLKTRSQGQVKWPGLTKEVVLHISRCVMTRQTQWHVTHGPNSILWWVIDVNVFVTCDDTNVMTSYDLYRGHQLAVRLIHWRILFESPRHGYVDLPWMSKNKWKDSQQGTFALTESWRPRKRCHSSTTKCHTNSSLTELVYLYIHAKRKLCKK